MGAVVLGDGGEVVEAGAGEILRGLDVFEDFADAELLALAGEFQGLLGGVEGFAGVVDLIGEGARARVGFDDLAGDLVAQPGLFEFADLHAGFAGADAALIEEPTGTDAPGEADAVVGAVVETARDAVVVEAAAETAIREIAADGGDERAEFRAVAGLLCGGDLRVALVQFGTIRKRRGHQRFDRPAHRGELHRRGFAAFGDEFDERGNVQRLGEAGGGDALALLHLAESQPIAFGLGDGAEGVALESDSGFDGTAEFAGVAVGDPQGFALDTARCLRLHQIEESGDGQKHALLALRFRAMLGRGDEAFRDHGFVDGVAEFELRDDAGTDSEALFIRPDDLAIDGLDIALVTLEGDAGREIREELHEGALMRGLGLGEALLGELDLERVRAGEAHDGGEIDGLGLAAAIAGEGGDGSTNKDGEQGNIEHRTSNIEH